MTDHGFFGTKAGSPIDVDDIAREVSKIPGVIFAHVVEGPRYNIMVEIDPRKPRKTHEDLLEEIYEVEGVHKEKTDVWRILRSYKNGKPTEKE